MPAHYSAPPVTAGSYVVGGPSPGAFMVHPGHAAAAAAAAAAGVAERTRSTEMLRQIGGARPGAMAAQYQHVRGPVIGLG